MGEAAIPSPPLLAKPLIRSDLRPAPPSRLLALIDREGMVRIVCRRPSEVRAFLMEAR